MYATAAARASFAVCPHCGRPMPPVRLGVSLFPQGARIFDLIAAAGPNGIEARMLFEAAYRFRGRHKPSFRALNAQIREIRRALLGTGIAVRGYHTTGRLWIYKLTKNVQIANTRLG